jgi:hypothetical protein
MYAASFEPYAAAPGDAALRLNPAGWPNKNRSLPSFDVSVFGLVLSFVSPS